MMQRVCASITRSKSPLRLFSTYPSKMSSCPYKQPAHKLTMIPGPIEFSDEVLYAMLTPSQAHTSPEFIQTFQTSLKNLRKVFKLTDPEAQPYVLAGLGTLGWDVAASNLVSPGEKVLVLSTGFFSDNFAECLRVHGADVDVITAELGDVVPIDQIKLALSKTKYAAITITQVDTSTAVLSDVEAISKAVKEVSPETLIIVDGVCSIASEVLDFDKWGVDFALTASQKAIGVPAGLAIFFASGRAQKKAEARKQTTWFASMKKWAPIMQAYELGKGAYFATPAVQTVTALKVGLDQILAQGVDERIKANAVALDKFKDAMEGLGLKLVAKNRNVAAHGLSAVYWPKGTDGAAFLGSLAKKGFVVAGGIHKEIVGTYFRVGHMGYSVTQDHVQRLTEAIKETLNELK